MPKSIRVLGWISNNAIRWLVPIGFFGWTYRCMHDVLNNVGVSAAIAISLGGLAATVWLAIGIAHAAQFYIERSQWADEGNRVAAILERLRIAGHSVVDARRVGNVWFAEQPSNEVLRLAIKEGNYALLREAVRRGWIRCLDFPAHEVRRNFQMDISDCIAFFRGHRWLEISTDE